MKRTHNSSGTRGFALPTVMIASVVMLMVLLSGLVSTSSVNTSLRSQYDNKLLAQAIDAGKDFALGCLEKNAGVANWSVLYPNSTCETTATTNLCPATGAPAACFLINTTSAKSTFIIRAVSTDANGVRTMRIDGYLRKLRPTDGSLQREMTDTKIVTIGSKKTVFVTQGISSGDTHTCALATDSRAYCWGNGIGGKLGNGNTVNSSVPVLVSQGAVPAGVTFTSIGVGQYSSCAIGSNGKAYCWGTNTYGQLGNNSTVSSSVPVAVAAGAIPSTVKLINISGGQHHTCATGDDDKAYCWGYNNAGQLGNNTLVNSSVPVAVQQGAIPAGVTVKTVSTKVFSTCAIGSNNRAYCWGQNGSNGTLGTGNTSNSSVPAAVAQGGIPANVSLLSANAGGSYHVCGVGSDSRAYCWGANANGTLGNNTTTNSLSPILVSAGTVTSGVSIASIEGGYADTCAISTAGRAYCWGFGVNGQLGNGASTSSNVPVTVSQGAIPAGQNFVSISIGSYHVCAISTENRVYCWGLNSSGQVGNNSTVNAAVPTAVSTSLSWQQNNYFIDTPIIY